MFSLICHQTIIIIFNVCKFIPLFIRLDVVHHIHMYIVNSTQVLKRIYELYFYNIMGIIAFNCKYVCTIFCIVYRILFYLFRFKIIFHLTLAAITTSIFYMKKKERCHYNYKMIFYALQMFLFNNIFFSFSSKDFFCHKCYFKLLAAFRFLFHLQSRVEDLLKCIKFKKQKNRQNKKFNHKTKMMTSFHVYLAIIEDILYITTTMTMACRLCLVLFFFLRF